MCIRTLYFLLLMIFISVTPQPLRLVSPQNNGVGRLEVYYNGSWGTICDDSFTNLGAKIACKQLGRYQAGFQPKAIPNFGFGSDKIWLDNVICSGTESSLSSCSHSAWGTNNCNHNEDVGVICDERSLYLKLTPGYSSGLLQVYHNNIWGIVCDDGFGKVEATVVCRTLGYDSGEFSTTSSSIRMWLDEVKCTMNNTDIRDCRHNEWGVDNCGPTEAVRIKCYSFPEGSTASRLVSSTNLQGEGRLEVLYRGRWGTVCYKGIGSEVAGVVCKMLGYGSGTRIGTLPGSGSVLLEDVNCKGTETNINECSHSEWMKSNCSHSQDTAVRCYDAEDMERGIRLVSSTERVGRVEILHNRVWGTVCGTGFTVIEARVVCRMANLPWFSAYVSSSHGRGDGVIWLSNVRCTGNETSLDQCSHNTWGTSTCSHSHDVGVVCIGARLSGGSDTRGRLEIFYANQWGTVCDVGFTNMSAKVVCQMLGQSSKHAYFTSSGSFGSGSGRIWLSNVRCSGSEVSLGLCSRSAWGSYISSCSHSRDVAVVCSYPPEIHLDPNRNVLEVTIGRRLAVECVVDDANPAVRSTHWSHKGRQFAGKTFIIQSVSKSDRGTLSCTADNGLGMTPGRDETLINVLYSPEVHINPNSYIINTHAGENLTVDCVVDDANPPVRSITWSHKGVVSSGVTFHIQSVNQSDEGRLTCTADNGVGRPGQADAFIRVQENDTTEAKKQITDDVRSGSSEWSGIHTVAVVTGVVAVVIIAVLIIIIIHLYRKHDRNVTMRDHMIVDAISNPAYETGDTEAGSGSRCNGDDSEEPAHHYEALTTGANINKNSDDVVYENMRVSTE